VSDLIEGQAYSTPRGVERYVGNGEFEPMTAAAEPEAEVAAAPAPEPAAAPAQAKREVEKIVNTYKAGMPAEATAAAKAPITQEQRTIAKQSNGMFTPSQLRLAEALGHERGGQMLARIASAKPGSQWKYMNTSDGGVVAIHASNPTNPIQIVKGTRPHKVLSAFAQHGIDPRTFPKGYEPLPIMKNGEIVGYQRHPDGRLKYKLIPESETAREIQEKEKAASAKKVMETSEGARAVRFADDALAMMKEDFSGVHGGLDEATGLVAEGRKRIPVVNWLESRAKTLENYVHSLRSTAGKDALTNMRNASESGASGLGQVTEREHSMLQATAGQWDTTQPKQLYKTIMRYKAGAKAMTEYGMHVNKNGEAIISSGPDAGVPLSEVMGRVDAQATYDAMTPEERTERLKELEARE
jgi:hypothetical protein